ncbi:carbohydrate-binding module family 43 protein, partial [Aureobasidium melanogenum]
MKGFGIATAIAAASMLVSKVAADVDPIVIKGSKFFYKTNGTQFFMRGVAYQEDVQNTTDSSYTDPLADESTCARDIPYLQALRTNTIRVYAIDPTKNHDACMNMLADAGIYVVSDLSAPDTSINRNDPAWNDDLYQRYISVVDALANYTNTLGFFAGNEVSNSQNTTNASAFVKAAVRDTKAYIKNAGYRQLGVGYATSDDSTIRVDMADYFDCSSDTALNIDFWGYNVYSWCDPSNYQESGYAARTEEFSTYSVPVFFAEYGCNTHRPRTWGEVSALYGDNMTEVWSGGIVYMYFETSNEYGLVSIVNNAVSTLADYSNLKSAMSTVSPTGVNSASYSPTNTIASCPAIGTAWAAKASPLPPSPNRELCQCMFNSLSCTVKSSVDEEAYGDMFGYVCGADSNACAGIAHNATTGTYGAYSMCNSTEQLGFVLDQYYSAQPSAQRASACAFSGSATLKSGSKPTGACSSLMAQAGTAGTGQVTASPTTGSGAAATGGSGNSGSSSKSGSGSKGAGSALSVQSVQVGPYTLGLSAFIAIFSGAAALLLACSATYTSSTSTTVIQSTVTVQPTPWTDAAANGGAPFVIRLQQVDVSGYPDQDTAPYWLTANGNTTTNSSVAAVYTINEGRLAILNGSHVATNFNVVDQAFGVTDYDLPINTTFSVNDRMLNWTNPLFTNGTAQFYKLPPGLLDNALILAKFLGPMEAERSWSPVILYVEPLVNNGTGLASSSASSVSSMSSMSSPMASGMFSGMMSSSMPSDMSSGVMSAPSMMESMTSSSANAVVGTSSATGGSSASTPLSSSASISGIGPVIVPSSSTVSTVASTSSMPPQTTYSCPVNNGETVQSNMGGTYQLGCNEALSGGGATQLAGSVTNLNACMMLCDQTDGCTAWTFDGVASCYIETGTSSSGITFQPSATQGTVSGIRNVPARPGSVGSTSSSATMASSAVQPVSSGTSIVSSASQSASSAFNTGSSSVVGVSSIASILSSVASGTSSLAVSSNAPSVASSASAISMSSVASAVSSAAGVIGGTSSMASSSSVSTPPLIYISIGIPGASVSSVVTSMTTSMPVGGVSSTSTTVVGPGSGSSLSSGSGTGTGTGSAPAATMSQTTYSCPSVNNQTVIDANGASYQIECDSDTTLGGTNYGPTPDFNGCMPICDSTPGCGGFTYNGNCYLKMPGNLPLQFTPAGTNYVAGIRNGTVPASTSSAGSGSGSSPSSASGTGSAPGATVSASSYSCPENNNQTVIDSNGSPYTIMCDADTTLPGQYEGPSASFSDCMTECDATTGCGGWTYNGACYLKIPGTNTVEFTSGPTGQVAGIKNYTQPVATPTSSPPPTCPSMNGTTITDARGAVYSIQCEANGQGTLLQVVTVTDGNGIYSCFAACDANPQCGAFVYSGDSTMTTGTCYIKENAGNPAVGAVPDTIAQGVLISSATIAAPSSATATALSSASSSSAAAALGGTSASTAAGTAAGTASGSAATASPVCTGAPLPSGSGSSTVLNPDGSTSTYNGLLPSPTRCDFGDPIDTDEDDSYCEIDLPFQVTMYGGSSNATFPSTNGLLTLVSGTTDYDSTPGLPNPYIPLYAAAPFFDDLFKSGSDLDQGIFYSYTATAVTYEYRLIRAGTTETYHFTVSYDSTNPGVFVYRYYDIGQDQGSASAAIGIQGSYDGSTQVAVQYSNQRLGAVVANSTLTCDTATTPATCVLSC